MQRLWTIANARLAPDAAKAWVAAPQQCLAHAHLCLVIHQVRLLYPKGVPLPLEVRQALAYLFANRQRMRYRLFPQASYPIGNSTVESACKVVVQQRMKQASMRWSRNGAQNLLPIRAAVLSHRFHDCWAAAKNLPPI